MNTSNNQTNSIAPFKPSALQVMATNLNVEPQKLLSTLKSTVFKGASDDELLALVVVSNTYGLSPLLKEIYAFPAKGGGIVPVVSIDGWIHLANSHPQMDGMDFEFAHDEGGKLVSCTCIIHRKDRSRPVKVTEYLAECRRGTEPWKMEHRMLRHKALIQCSRVAFGFSGIVDDEEAATLRDVTPPPAAVIPTTVEKPKKATRPAKEEFAEESPVTSSPHEALTFLIRESGLTWEQVGATAETGGIFLDTAIPLNDQPEDVVAEILDNWGALTAMLKGGAK